MSIQWGMLGYKHLLRRLCRAAEVPGCVQSGEGEALATCKDRERVGTEVNQSRVCVSTSKCAVLFTAIGISGCCTTKVLFEPK